MLQKSLPCWISFTYYTVNVFLMRLQWRTGYDTPLKENIFAGYTKYPVVGVEFEILFNGTSTIVGHFVSSPREREKGTGNLVQVREIRIMRRTGACFFCVWGLGVGGGVGVLEEGMLENEWVQKQPKYWPTPSLLLQEQQALTAIDSLQPIHYHGMTALLCRAQDSTFTTNALSCARQRSTVIPWQ